MAINQEDDFYSLLSKDGIPSPINKNSVNTDGKPRSGDLDFDDPS